MMRRIYLRIRRMVDYDIEENQRPASLVLGFVPLIVAGMAGVEAASVSGGALWFVLLTICLVWTSFVLWRAYRMSRAWILRSDRDYDRRGKFLLSREYWQSESATSARRRRRRAGG